MLLLYDMGVTGSSDAQRYSSLFIVNKGFVVSLGRGKPVRRLHDKEEIESFLRKDTLLYIYGICDLDGSFREDQPLGSLFSLLFRKLSAVP